MSHDLRSPISSINAFIDILDYEEMKAEDFTEVKANMHNQINAVMLLLDNLLHWASNSFKGQEVVNPEVLNMHELAQLSITLLQNTARVKDIEIQNNIAINIRAYGSYEQTDIVIRNLIANAIKFIPQSGRITLSAKIYDNIVAISIADTGVGMTDEQITRLFTKSQTSTYGTRGEKGVGLGLLLCKEFIEMNGGGISVMSELNKGSVFTITLPVPPATA
jgi:signal transduction histidine kinase